MSKDGLIRATALGGQVRAFAVRTTDVVEELRKRHGMTPVTTAALGRTISAGAMMGAMLKGEEKLTLQIKGGGPIGQVVVDANAKGEVRGYVQDPTVDLPLNPIGKLDVAGAVGTDGNLYVIKDLGLKEPYRGSIPLVTGEIAEDFTHYFAKSEQTPSVVALGVLVDVDGSVKASGGFIIQVLPGTLDEEIEIIEEGLSRMPPVSAMLAEGAELDEILATALGMVKTLDHSDVTFKCRCSRERVETTLISLGREELQDLLDEDGQAEVHCHFCNEAYAFNRQELEELIEKIQ